MWKTLLRPAMIFVPLTLGALCPAAHQWSFLIRWLIMIMMLMVFLRLNVKELSPRRSHLWIFAANVLIGIGAFLLARLLKLDNELAQSAFFVGITPTATAAAVVMGFLGGSIGYVITAFMITNVGIALLFPLLLPWICGNASWDFVAKVAESLVMLIGIPGIAALIVRKLHPAATEWPKKLATATFGLWSVALFFIAAVAADFFVRNPDVSKWVIAEIAVISLVICALNFALGYLLGEKGLRREASQSLGQKNTTLTIYLALIYAGPLAAMGVTFYVLWHNSYNAIQMFIYDRQQQRLNGENSAADADK